MHSWEVHRLLGKCRKWQRAREAASKRRILRGEHPLDTSTLEQVIEGLEQLEGLLKNDEARERAKDRLCS